METNNEQMVEAPAPENETQFADPDKQLEAGMKIEILTSQYDDLDERTKANTNDEFNRLLISYQRDEVELKVFYNSIKEREKYYNKTVNSARKNEQRLLAAEKTYNDAIALYTAKRIERHSNFKLYFSILEKLISKNEIDIEITKKSTQKDGRLPLLREYRKQMKKYQSNIEGQIAIFNVGNLVETNTKIVFTDKRSYLTYEDVDIRIGIRDKVYITDANGWNAMDLTKEFDLEKFLNYLPKKYWLGLYRQRQIDSIFE